MNYCNTCDIAYEKMSCPLCVAEEKIEELSKNVEELEQKVEELENK